MCSSDLHGQDGDGAIGALTRAEMERVLQMLASVVGKAGWLTLPQQPQAAEAPAAASAPKPIRH